VSIDTAKPSATSFSEFLQEEAGHLDEKIDLMASLLSIGVAGDEEIKGVVIEEIANIFDSLLSQVSSMINPEASKIIGPPLVDLFEIVECVGIDALEDALSNAFKILANSEGSHVETVRVLSDCLGWKNEPPLDEPVLTASALIMSLTGALNKAIIKYNIYSQA